METRTAGAGGGSGKPTDGNAGGAPRADLTWSLPATTTRSPSSRRTIGTPPTTHGGAAAAEQGGQGFCGQGDPQVEQGGQGLFAA
ncbi:hypothetical protein ACFV2X_46540 [Streptomyces sp. NPDC059679]|uniref:hypothetical protein n=1 Tax=Streptomyces sp. NPDC059679 TaxID=3346903 RepID=UPI0036C24BBF